MRDNNEWQNKARRRRRECVWMRRECGLKQLAFVRVHAAAGEAPLGALPRCRVSVCTARIFSSNTFPAPSRQGSSRWRRRRLRIILIIASYYHYSPWHTLTHRPLKSNVCICNGWVSEQATHRTWPVESQKLGSDDVSRDLERKLFVLLVIVVMQQLATKSHSSYTWILKIASTSNWKKLLVIYNLIEIIYACYNYAKI